MKNLLIILLSLALAAAAFITRPSPESFTDFLVREHAMSDHATSDRGVRASVDASGAAAFSQQCQFVDRILWIDVKKDGQTLYTGAFSHWVPRNVEGK
jgi:hypothetical protein